jgi:hypothetical protein
MQSAMIRKKIISTLILIHFFIVIFAQNNSGVMFSICKNKEATISFAELKKCHELVSSDKVIAVKSFAISILVNSKKNPEGFYRDFSFKSSMMDDASLLYIKELLLNDPYVKVMVEKIITSSEDKKIKNKGFTFYVK